MTKKLARLLRADIQETSDLKSIAAMLAGKGRGKDTILAHITPKEAEILKEAGGSGTTNPDTGLLEFEGGFEGGGEVSAPSSIYDLNYGQAPSEGFQLPAAGTPEVGFQQEAAGPSPYSGVDLRDPSSAQALYQTPEIATARPVPVGLQAGGAGTDTLLTGTRPDVSKAGTAEKPFLSNEQMVRLGLSGGLGVYGAMQQKKAAEQNKQATGEQKALAAPYQKQGQELVRAAQAGELTPEATQRYQALKSQLAQGVEQRGGVGAAQAAAQAEAFRNQLLQGQYDYGLKVSQIGDNIALGAIRTGMQLDQQLNQANMAFYTQLGSLAAGVPMYRSA
jgi:hypothetical protein